MKIIKEARRHYEQEYQVSYTWRDDPGAGFGFRADGDGNVDVESLPEPARCNYEACISGEFDVTGPEIQTLSWAWTEPARGRCVCGNVVELSGFTNGCDRCGRDYDIRGNELAPREQWGWETGESPADILRIP